MASPAIHRRQRHDAAHPAGTGDVAGTLRPSDGLSHRFRAIWFNMFKWGILVVRFGEQHGR